MRQKIQWVLGLVGLIGILLVGNVFVLKSAIVEQAGLAVAASLNKWNPVQDAIVGDGLQSGVLANGLFAWTGTAFNRLRMDGSNNLLMNLATAVPGGTNSIGNVGLNAGTNSIGTVGLNAGTNTIGVVNGGGVAGTPNTGVMTIQGISGGTVVPVSTPNGTALFVEGAYGFNHITSNATTVVKSQSGIVHTIVINNAGTTWSIQVCDNATSCASGTIATISPVAGSSYLYDAKTNNGITIVTSGTTAGDMTVSFN